jgi:hypothetical protein
LTHSLPLQRLTIPEPDQFFLSLRNIGEMIGSRGSADSLARVSAFLIRTGVKLKLRRPPEAEETF